MAGSSQKPDLNHSKAASKSMSRNERTFLTNPAVVDVPMSSQLRSEAAQEPPIGPQVGALPIPDRSRSELLPRIAVSARWHPELHQNYSSIWGCQANFNIDENGNKIPTSKLDLSTIKKRCGVKDYDKYLPNAHAKYKACKNCEPDRLYVARRLSQEDDGTGQDPDSLF